MAVFYVWLLLTPGILGQIVTPPENVVVAVGETVTITCRATSSADKISWIEYVSNILGRTVYDSDRGIIDPGDVGKYEVSTPHDLTIYDLGLEDGGFYACMWADDSNPLRSDVIVIEAPVLVMPELIEGASHTLSCSAQYGSPLHEFLEEEQIPTIHAMIDGVPIDTGDTSLTKQAWYTLKYDFNYTGNSADNGKNFSCAIRTAVPQYEAVTTEPLDVKYPVREITYEPQNPWYYVGETINCHCQGNPAPDYRWRPILSNGGAIISNATLVILANMVGENQWECQATNIVAQTEAIVIRTDIFEVLASTASPSTMPPRR